MMLEHRSELKIARGNALRLLAGAAGGVCVAAAWLRLL
jgi:hypothetical protein